MNQVLPYGIWGEITAIDSPDVIGLGQKFWVRVECWTLRARIKFVARLLQPPDYSREKAVTVAETEPEWVPPLHHLTADFELTISEKNVLGPNILEVEFWTWDLWWEVSDVKTRENFVMVQKEPVEVPPPAPPPRPRIFETIMIMLLLMMMLFILPIWRRS